MAPEWPSLKSLQIRKAREGVKKGKPSYSVGRNANWCDHIGKQNFSKKKEK